MAALNSQQSGYICIFKQALQSTTAKLGRRSSLVPANFQQQGYVPHQAALDTNQGIATFDVFAN
jgi:hypothetical protein